MSFRVAEGIHFAGRGLLSSHGDLMQTLQALRRAPVDAPLTDVAPGWRWPLHPLPPMAGPWQQRLAQAVRAVVAQTGFAPTPGTPLFLASSSLDIGYEEEQARAGGAGHGNFMGDLHSFADAVVHALAWPGPVFCFSSACTSAVQALLAARDWLCAGESDAGDDALLLAVEMDNLFTPAGFGGLQLLSPDRARPFAAARNGLVLGQAVAALHLRRAPTRWRLSGAANVVDGSQPTGAVPEAIVAAARSALAEAGCTAQDVALVKPQAAGSPGNDAAEAQALQAIFGPAVPPMIGFKPWIGHGMGASAAAELALLMHGLEEGIWPAELPADAQPDPALGLAWATPERHPDAPRRVLFHTIGFGGGHSALVVEQAAP